MPLIDGLFAWGWSFETVVAPHSGISDESQTETENSTTPSVCSCRLLCEMSLLWTFTESCGSANSFHLSYCLGTERSCVGHRWTLSNFMDLQACKRLDELLNRLTPSDNSDSNAARELLLHGFEVAVGSPHELQ